MSSSLTGTLSVGSGRSTTSAADVHRCRSSVTYAVACVDGARQLTGSAWQDRIRMFPSADAAGQQA